MGLEYDPIKAKIGWWIRRSKALRRLFYVILGRLFLRERYVKRELKQVADSGIPIRNILDAGSGYGQISWFCAKLFPKVDLLGIDVKTEQVEDCNWFFQKMGYSQCRFQVDDLETIAYDSQFDLVFSIDVMEHVVKDEVVLGNFFRALRTGGICILHLPYRDPKKPVSDDPTKVDSVVAEHVREGYTPEEIRLKLAQAGFEVEKVMFTYGEYGVRVWKRLQGNPMKWLDRSKWAILLFPFYYMVIYPVAAYRMRKDLATENTWGGAMLVVAKKLESVKV
jgi:SAM-dependent methyltransferase